MRPPDYLTLPLLQTEVDPTQTDLRQIQRWALTIPRLTYTASVGVQPPGNIEPLWTVSVFTGTPSSGLLTIPITGYSYGYIPLVAPGDTVVMGMCLPVLASCTLHTLVVACYTLTGSPVSGTGVRVNYQLIGA